jgi:N-acetylglucosaminyldiphosphoundecaprenol N-acetyl-beta-D-mannosaminyltransferase
MSDSLTRVRLFGLDFVDATSVEEITDVLLATTSRALDGTDGRLPAVVTPNVDQLVKRHNAVDAVASSVAEQAQFVLADGQPIVWASRMLGRPLRTRLAGSSLTAALWPRLVADGRRAVVIAASATVAELVRREGSTVEAIAAPLLSLDNRREFDDFVAACRDTALRCDAEFVFVTLGYPKQCNIIDAMVRSWPADRATPVFLAVGASFDMYYGLVRRAPVSMQRVGLEWLFRFVQEPRRLFVRYFVDDLAFGPMIFREWRLFRQR